MTTLSTIAVFLISFIFLFSTKTEHHRVVTIQKPIVINQERKTPAFFAYQQSQFLQKKKIEPRPSRSTFLSNLQEQPQVPHFQLSELRLTKSDYFAYQASQYRSRMIAGTSYDQPSFENEKVVFKAEDNFGEEYADAPTVLSPERRWATIQGKFELRDGVGITDHIIDIKRVEEGLVREQGRINLSAGSYSIEIESPNGVLVAQIRDKTGLIIGEDRQRLVNLQNRGGFLEGPFIKVGRPDGTLADAGGAGSTGNSKPSPPPSGSSGSTVASTKAVGSSGGAAGSGGVAPTAATFSAAPASTSGGAGLVASFFNNQKTLTRATDEFTNVSTYSSTISRIYDPSQIYSNVVSIRMAGEKAETPMFTKKWLENSVSIISKNQQTFFKVTAPILIGRVIVDGQPLAGAQVQTDKMTAASVVYLDQFLNPSTALTETSTNGYFILVGVDEGPYEVIAINDNHIIGSQLFSAENDSIAYQNIYSRSIPLNQMIRSYDAFTSDPVETDVYSGSQDEVIQTAGGSAQIRSYVENNVSEFAVRTSDPQYVPIKFTQGGRKDYVHIPMIQENWLSEIKKIKLVNDLPGTGTVIGFTPNLKYEVYLASDNYEKSNIVYFSKDGEISGFPQSDGGFIMFNVPVGAKEIVLQNLENEQISSQVLTVDNQQLSVLNFSN